MDDTLILQNLEKLQMELNRINQEIKDNDKQIVDEQIDKVVRMAGRARLFRDIEKAISFSRDIEDYDNSDIINKCNEKKKTKIKNYAVATVFSIITLIFVVISIINNKNIVGLFSNFLIINY